MKDSAKIICILLVGGLIPLSAVAQQGGDVGNWIMYFGRNQLSDQFSIHTEVQYRNYTASPDNIEQLLLRPALNFHLSANIILTAGYTYIANHEFESEDSAPETEEHNIWEQLLIKQPLGRVYLEHRYRVEQRWIEMDYRSRLRYRLTFLFPLNTKKIEPGSVFIGMFDEIFVNTEEDFFDRNWFYSAIGYQFTKATSAQVGMLNQRVSSYGKWYLQFALFINPDFRKNDSD